MKIKAVLTALVLWAGISTSAAPAELSYAIEGISDKVVVRSTVRLRFRTERIVLYTNGKCLLSMGDSQTVEGTYEIADEGNWVIFYFTDANGEVLRVSASCTVRNGVVQSITFNGNTYR